ncbi:centrosomal protein of 63 kDa-like [Melanaphis sacchari]|uniref:centrosomal protein of 63 kDa-like n=1 Tax=Melanaphis sacchari TaxID=742174 RepID=UPI000DC13D92|nr:centrosomal protein of 63 kDa-like [Melanaphis sacchari]
MSGTFQQTNISNQTTYNDENKKDQVINCNYQLNGRRSLSDITENKIVVMDYMTAGGQINLNLNSFDNSNYETIVLYKLNTSFEDILKIFKEKLISRIVDGKYVISHKDAINLDKMIGFATSESEKNNKQLKNRNRTLRNKYESNNCVVKEHNKLKSEMNKIIINLRLALGRRFDDKEDVMHLINICAALVARESEYHYILAENDKLKNSFDKQLMNIRVKTLSNYDEILHNVEKLKEELYIKDLKISQLKDEIYSVNKEQNTVVPLQLLHENLSEFPKELIDEFHGTFDNSQNNNELYEGKMLIAEQINQIQGFSNFKSENHQLSDLINMLTRLTADKEEHLKIINRRSIRNIEDKNQQLIKEIDDNKEWQKHLENENEKLNYEIEHLKQVQITLIGKENEHKNLKEDHSKMQLMYDKLNKENAHLLTLLNDYRQRLTDREMKYVDGNNLIKTLQTNLTEQTNKFEFANAMYNKEKEKCQRNESYTQQIVNEFTSQLHEKDINITVLQNECNDLKHSIESVEADIENLKHKTITLEYVLNEKNKTIQNMLKTQSKQQHKATSRSSLLSSDNQLHIKSQLEQQMDVFLDNLSTWQNTIVGYEKVLNNMQNAVLQQSKKRNYLIAKYQYFKDIEYKATLTENLTKENAIILSQHQNEIKDIKEKYDSKIAHITNTETELRNENRDLKESLKLKSAHIMIAEQIASSQLKESLKTIQHLTEISNIQSLKLKNIQNSTPKRCCDTHLLNTTNKRFQQMKGLVDYMLKLKSKNKVMKKLCEIRNKRLQLLDKRPCICTRKTIMKMK